LPLAYLEVGHRQPDFLLSEAGSCADPILREKRTCERNEG